MASAPTCQSRSISVSEQHHQQLAESSSHTIPDNVCHSTNTDNITLREWEELVMQLVECWLWAEKDPCLWQIVHHHMTKFNAAQATGVIYTLLPGHEAKLQEAVVAHSQINYNALSTNLPIWVPKFQNRPPCCHYQLPTFSAMTMTPPLQQLQRQS